MPQTGDVDALIVAVRDQPAGTPGRGVLAAAAIGAVLQSGSVEPGRMRQLAPLLAIADQDPPAGAEWPALRAVARATVLTWDAAERRLPDPRAALAEVRALAAEHRDSRFAPLFASSELALRYAAGVAEGDVGALADAVGGLRQIWADPLVAAHPFADPTVDVVEKAAAVVTVRDNGGDVRQALAELTAAADRLPPGHPMRTTVAETTAMLGMAVTMTSESSAEQIEAATAAAGNPALSAADRVLYQAGAAVAELQSETDPARVDAAIERLRDVLRRVAPADPQRAFLITGVALGLYRRCELTNRMADLDEAAGLLAEARELAGGPHHPQWQMINEMLGVIRGRRGRTPGSHKTEVDGLRAYLWRVLVQSDLGRATEAVRDAARDAVDIARRCLAAGDPEAAIQALDTGRGLALFAAAEVRTVADRLATAGRPDLAARWRTAAATGDPAALPGDLRHEVLTALAADGSAASLLDPPAMPEIQDALRAVDADALVYLIPGDRGLGGWAVAVAASGPPSYLALPNLLPRDDDVEGYLHAAGDEALEASLERLCDWAWRAAIGPLVTSYLPRLTRVPGRVPRIVLVPVGELARIPWQAARMPGDGSYAIEHVAISQAASARMLCWSAALPRIPVTAAGLVLGDPDTGGDPLAKARVEAYAIHRSFYPAARYLGRYPDRDGTVSRTGPGRRDELTRWLGGPAARTGTMLHLACHAVTEPGRSYLALAGGDQLRAEDVAGLAPEHPIGLVVLAACRSGVPVGSYDEAYSLGSAFLAGGARTVLTTQWEVPDGVTSRLMFMFHHYLVVERQPAWAALRAAQLWMLDPGRKLPDGAPEPLQRGVRGVTPRRVVAWAGFVHWGQ